MLILGHPGGSWYTATAPWPWPWPRKTYKLLYPPINPFFWTAVALAAEAWTLFKEVGDEQGESAAADLVLSCTAHCT